MKPMTDLSVRLVPVGSIRPHPENPRANHQVARIIKSIQSFGWRQPIVVDADGVIIVGHGRYYAAREMGLTEVPVHYATDLTPDEAMAYRIADNRAGESEWDFDLLVPQLEHLASVDDLSFNIEAIGFDKAEIDKLLNPDAAPAAGPKLTDRFLIPPFSVFDTRQGYWLNRKRAWVALGLRSELGRGDDGTARTYGQDLMRGEHVVGDKPKGQRGLLLESVTGRDNDFYRKKQEAEKRLGRELTTADFLANHYVDDAAGGTGISATGTSIFDPVLCEIVYRWFTPPGGMILDPFAGGSVRGVVAGLLGRRYVGVDLRDEQVRANREQWAAISASTSAAASPADRVPIRISSKSARQKFAGCSPDYIRDVCHAACCRSSTAPSGVMVTIHATERAAIEAGGD